MYCLREVSKGVPTQATGVERDERERRGRIRGSISLSSRSRRLDEIPRALDDLVLRASDVLVERVLAPVRVSVDDGDEDVHADGDLHAVVIGDEVCRRRATACCALEVGGEASRRASGPQNSSSLSWACDCLAHIAPLSPSTFVRGLVFLMWRRRVCMSPEFSQQTKPTAARLHAKKSFGVMPTSEQS